MKARCLLMGLAAVSCNPSLTAERRGAVVSTTRGFLFSHVKYINFVFFSHTVQELL